MSLVIGASYNGKAVIAADSGGFNGKNGHFEVMESPRKIQEIGGVLYGLVKSWEDIQVLKEIKAESQRSDKKYHMKRVLRRFEEKRGSKDLKGLMVDGEVLGRLYNCKAPRHLSTDKHRFAAVGCGSKWAEGYMNAEKKRTQDPETLVESTFLAVQSTNKFIEPPIRTITNKSHQ